MTSHTSAAGTTAGTGSSVRIRILAVVAATIAAAAVWLIADAAGASLAVDQGDGPKDLTFGSVFLFAPGAALAGWGLLALLEKFKPAGALKLWTVIASVVLVLSFGLPFGMDSSGGTRVAQLLMHLVTGVTVISVLRRSSTGATDR
ncbi:DUF6069 family protein [Streptomyces aculeolatus]